MRRIEHKGQRRWLGARPLRTRRAILRALARPLVLALVGLLGLLLLAPTLGLPALAQSGGWVATFDGAPTSPSQSLAFTVARQPAGTPATVTVPVIVMDDCGEWNMFAGGGPTSF